MEIELQERKIEAPAAGIRTSMRRLLRIMRGHGLLAPKRPVSIPGPQAHDRTIVTDRPDRMWSIDANGCLTDAGNATVFVLVNRCTSECVGVRAAVRGSRFEAMKFLREAAWATKGHYEVGITRGTSLRHDHGSQFIYHALRDELKTLGIESRPPFDRQPEGDGWAERFIRALKVQLLSLRRFGPVADLGRALREFRDRFSQYWIIGRIGCQSYPQDRCKLLLATPS